MHFEHRNEPLLPFQLWLHRVAKSIWLAVAFILTMLTVGIMGYHYLGLLPWIDSLVEASMILGGMGPVSPLANSTIKVFASIYALMSGLVIVGISGILLAPWLHRMLHRFTIDSQKIKGK